MSTTGWTSNRSTRAPAELQRRLNTLQRRYGHDRAHDRTYRLEVAINRRMMQLKAIRNQIAELEARAQSLEQELEGFDKGITVLAEEAIAEYERKYPEAWSPTAVLGYRLWVMSDNTLVGARRTWPSPEYVATCSEFLDAGEVPHTDDRCGRLGCGVYATKELAPLLELHVRERDRGYAVGLVALQGKVVEHEDGYRAALARVTSLALIGSRREVYTTEPSVITKAFADPEAVVDSEWSTPLREPVLEGIARYLTNPEEEKWI